MVSAVTARMDPALAERECKGLAGIVSGKRLDFELAMQALDCHNPETLDRAEDLALDVAVAIADLRLVCARCAGK